MKTKHAPGPWFVWEGGVYAGRPEVKRPGELRGYDAKICEMDDMDGTARSRKANANLIAAAPDLLRYLKEARRTLEMWKDVAPAVSLCADIDAAIARATGEQP